MPFASAVNLLAIELKTSFSGSDDFPEANILVAAGPAEVAEIMGFLLAWLVVVMLLSLEEYPTCLPRVPVIIVVVGREYWL